MKLSPILRMSKAPMYNWEDLFKQGDLRSEGLTIHLKYTVLETLYWMPKPETDNKRGSVSSNKSKYINSL